MNLQHGITPAYAGKSFRQIQQLMSFEDHPRLRGEKADEVSGEPPAGGSPPLTRGKVFCFGVLVRCSGITPAYAGKSCNNLYKHLLHRDHPRLRGEKQRLPNRLFCHIGSPPLTRGKVGFAAAIYASSRITPAYAGKSPCSASSNCTL